MRMRLRLRRWNAMEEERRRSSKERKEKAAAKLTLLINKPRTCVGVRTQQVALPHHDTCLEQP